MRIPLSWLRDFAPFGDEPAALAATLDDLGLVVEATEQVGEGLEDVVVARVADVRPIEGADKIRLAVVEAGAGPVEVVCGASNFSVGDLVALAPVGAVLPGGLAIARRTMKGVTSNGMLCSGAELGLSDDDRGIIVLDPAGASGRGRWDGLRGEETPLAPGTRLVDALGLEPDVVFDVTIEGNRPDAASVRGVARDLAARLGLPFTDDPPLLAAAGSGGRTGREPQVATGPPVGELATVRVEDADLCPRFLARVVTGVQVGDSPPWLARRLVMAGMRPINNVVDASNYVMLELGQPTHPYDLDRLDGAGLLVRRARPGERLATLDGVERVVGRTGRGPGEQTGDCLICDAHGEPVGIAGIMGGASSEIAPSTARVLLEAAYFAPMAIARTSKRLGLRTEASTRFERGCDPAVLDRAADRIVAVLALSAGSGLTVADGVVDARGEVPAPRPLRVRPRGVNALLGTHLHASEMAALLGPIGIEAEETTDAADGEALTVIVPTFRPDIRDGVEGEADIAEEVARIYGYSRLPRRTPSWPQPGRLTRRQGERRLLRDVLVGLGATEVWTPTLLAEDDQRRSGVGAPYVEVSNPLVEAERHLRASMAPGLLKTLRYNADRRHPDLALFEVGAVFRPARSVGDAGRPVEEVERLSAVFAGVGEDAWTAVSAWRMVADALRLADWSIDQSVGAADAAGAAGALHPTRSGLLLGPDPADDDRAVPIGTVGEIAPEAAEAFGLMTAEGLPRRVGWLDLDLDTLLDPDRLVRRSADAHPVSRYPSADIDLAFVVPDAVPAAAVAATLGRAAGDLNESVELFDVYRGRGIAPGRRSLAYRLRFSALDHTLSDGEIAHLRTRCIEGVSAEHGAELRG